MAYKITDKCISCGACAASCPVSCISQGDDKYIINKDVSNLSETMVINAGKSSGIDVDMPVITEQGLVGYIMSVTENTAKVQPIIDPATNISGTITTSRDSVIVRGILRKQ